MKKYYIYGFAALVVMAGLAGGCGQRKTPLDTNLLANGSFESFVENVPEHWRILNFRGLQTMKPATYGRSDSLASDGAASFFFKGKRDTRRFFLLSQEVKVHDVRRVRLRGMIRYSNLRAYRDQYSQASLALTFLDKDRNRFEGGKVWDVATPVRLGSSKGWELQERTVRLPEGTAFIVVHCVFGMTGTVWFDDLSLEVPSTLPWKKQEAGNFVHFWVAGHEYPEGSIEFQQQLYDQYANFLGIPEEKKSKIFYYFYPDTASFFEATGSKRIPYVDYDIGEIHSVNPADDHEIIHLLTNTYGQLPQALAEGTAYYLIGEFEGEYIQPAAQRLLREGKLPSLKALLSPALMPQLDPRHVIIAGASFVGYLLEYGGPEKFLDLHGASAGIIDFDGFEKAFESVYGTPLAVTEKDWIRKLKLADFSKWTKPGESEKSKETTPNQ